MSIARDLEEAVENVPWDLHEAYGVKTGDEMYMPRSRKGPKYTGLFGSAHTEAMKKGYVDLGLVDPKVAATTKMLNVIYPRVASLLMTDQFKGVAFVRDPEGIIKQVGIDPKKIASAALDEIASHCREEASYASERDDPQDEDAWNETAEAVEKARITVSEVKGRSGAGYRFVMSPTMAELDKTTSKA